MSCERVAIITWRRVESKPVSALARRTHNVAQQLADEASSGCVFKAAAGAVDGP